MLAIFMSCSYSVSSTDGDHSVGTSYSSWSAGPPAQRYIGKKAKNTDSLYTEAGGECQPLAVWALWQAGRSPSNQGKQNPNHPLLPSAFGTVSALKITCLSLPLISFTHFSWYSSIAWHVTWYYRAVHETAKIIVKQILNLHTFKRQTEGKGGEMPFCINEYLVPGLLDR